MNCKAKNNSLKVRKLTRHTTWRERVKKTSKELREKNDIFFKETLTLPHCIPEIIEV